MTSAYLRQGQSIRNTMKLTGKSSGFCRINFIKDNKFNF